MRWALLTLLVVSLAFAATMVPLSKILANKTMIICKGSAPKVMLLNTSEVPKVVSELKVLGCNPIIDHFYTIKVLRPSSVNVKVAMPYSTSTTFDDSNISIAWQLDSEHMDAAYAWQQYTGSSVGVAIIDTGISDSLPSTMSVAVDYADGAAITATVDTFAYYGICNDTGTINFTAASAVKPGLPYVITTDWLLNYTMPSITFKYCLIYINSTSFDFNGDGKPDTVVILQADQISDQAGHGTFVASQVVGYFQNITKIEYEQYPTPFGVPILEPIGTTFQKELVTGVAPPFAKNKVYVIPIKSDVLALIVFDKGFTNMTQLLNNLTVLTKDGTKRYLKDAILTMGMFDDFSLQAAAQYAAELAAEGKAKVVNMSLGGWSDYTYYSQFCQNIVNPMLKAGLTVVAAAGNEGTDIKEANLAGLYEVPGECPGVVSVAAIDPSLSLADFSNYDPVTFAAPGLGTIGLYPKGSLLQELELQNYFATPYDAVYGTLPDGNILAYSSGTSYASPEVAGAIAYLYSLGISLSAIEYHARDLSISGYDKYTGYGMPAPGYVLKSWSQQTDTTTTTPLTHTTTLMSTMTNTTSVTNTTSLQTTTQFKIPGIGLAALAFAFLRRRRKRK